jgi:hypothetical protein
MSHLGSISGREPTVDLKTVAVVKGPGAQVLVVPATVSPLKLVRRKAACLPGPGQAGL